MVDTKLRAKLAEASLPENLIKLAGESHRMRLTRPKKIQASDLIKEN
jgi:hypothetical protein